MLRTKRELWNYGWAKTLRPGVIPSRRMLRKKRELWSGSPQDPIPKAYCLFKFLAFDLGVATLERLPRLWGIGGAGPDRCGIASSGRNLLRDRWLGVALWPPPFARSSACRSVPCDL